MSDGKSQDTESKQMCGDRSSRASNSITPGQAESSTGNTGPVTTLIGTAASAAFMGLFRGSSSAKTPEEAASEPSKLRQEYQALEDKYSKLKQNCQQLEKKIKSLEHDAQGMARKYNELSKAHRSLEKHAREATKDADELQATCNELQETLKSSEEENQNIKAQVIQYKTMISMAGRQNEQTADDVIAANASEIFHSLQNFVVQRFRRAAISYDSLPQDVKEWLRKWAPGLAHSSSIPVIQVIICIISRIIIRRAELDYAFGVSDENAVGAAIHLVCRQHPRDPDTKAWINATRKAIDKNMPGLLEKAEDATIREMLRQADHDLGAAVSVLWTEQMQQELSKIFKSCLNFFRLLQRQTAGFSVVMIGFVQNDGRCHQFEPLRMEDVSTGGEEDLADPVVGVSVFPGVYKTGDGQGGNASLPSAILLSEPALICAKMQQKSTIAKAKVVLQQDPFSRPAQRTSRSYRVCTSSMSTTHGGVALPLRPTPRRDH